MRVIVAASPSVEVDQVVAGAIRTAKSKGIMVTSLLYRLIEGETPEAVRMARAAGVSVEGYRADETAGEMGGLRRDRLMIAEAEAVIVVWDGVSVGELALINLALKKGIPLHVQMTAQVWPILREACRYRW